MHPSIPTPRIEFPTLFLIALTYLVWIIALVFTPLWLAFLMLSLAIAMHSSLCHEVLHNHPTPWQSINTALVRPGLGLTVPYGRFRDTHLAHHLDEHLTDPYDDPESNFLDPNIWPQLPRLLRLLLNLNNTLLGRIILGPAIGTVLFIRTDIQLIQAKNRRVLLSWCAHLLWTLPVILVVLSVGFPFWIYLLACYGGQSVIRIRTFLEHRAHLAPRARTVVIEDKGPLAFLFLYNNFHVVHHMHPNVSWYRLPAIYFANSAHYLRRNDGYRYASYAQVFRAYAFCAKDPVPHPLLPQSEFPPLSQPILKQHHQAATGGDANLDLDHNSCRIRAKSTLYAATPSQSDGP